MEGSLWLAVSWAGDQPLAALAGFVDPAKKTMYSFMSGYNVEFDKLSPGRVLDGYSIRYGIEQGYQSYDYLRGDSGYKYSLGGQERFTQSLVDLIQLLVIDLCCFPTPVKQEYQDRPCCEIEQQDQVVH